MEVILFFAILALPAFAESTLSLDETLRSLDGAGKAELRWDPFFASGTFTVGGHEVAFASGRAGESGAVLLDRKDILTLPLPYLEKSALKFPETFVTQIKTSFSRPVEQERRGEPLIVPAVTPAPAADTRFRIAAIIIDPGHGGRDPGAIGEHTIRGKTTKFIEKDITLKVSRQLHASLAASFPGKRVLLTRTGDTNPSKEARVELANSIPLAANEAAIYVSVHANASFNKNARGYEVWYLSPNYRREVIDRSRYTDTKEVIPILNDMLEEELTTESVLMARYILKRLEEGVGKQTPSRGLKAEEWFVVRNARMPSVLVELGFVSNEDEALLMNDDTYLKNLSDALYKGISDFITFFERSGGFTTIQ